MADNRTDIQNLTDAIALLQERLDELEMDMSANDNAFFMCSMSLIIFLMQCGFAFLEAGAVRSKNTTNILIKNLLDSCIAVVCYWSFGWALAYGPTSDDTVGLFIGTSQFFLQGLDNYAKFFFQYVFAATSATIVSGAVAERCEFVNYITYCTVISTFVYPILTHWGWSEQGWMYKGIKSGNISTTYVDFAGAGVVHLCGGTISIIAAKIIGPRIGRFEENESSQELKGHSVPFAALGGFILMFGFLAFNGGSTADIVQKGEGQIVALAMVNTILSGAFAALTYLAIHYWTVGKWTLLLTINACLAGMVSSCAGCNQMDPWACVFVGGGAGLIYLGLSTFMVKMRIDDPLDAFAVHAGGGFWGLMCACLISRTGIFYAIFNSTNVTVGQAFAQLGWQLICAFAIIVWSALWMIPIFLFLKKIGFLRVPTEVEIKGLDIHKHGEAAYPLYAYGHGWDNFEPLEESRRQSRAISNNFEVAIEELAAAYRRSTLQKESPPHSKRPSFKEKEVPTISIDAPTFAYERKVAAVKSPAYDNYNEDSTTPPDSPPIVKKSIGDPDELRKKSSAAHFMHDNNGHRQEQPNHRLHKNSVFEHPEHYRKVSQYRKISRATVNGGAYIGSLSERTESNVSQN